MLEFYRQSQRNLLGISSRSGWLVKYLRNTFCLQHGSKNETEDKSRKSCRNICEEWIQKFTSADIPEPDVSAELIISHIMGYKMFHEVPKDMEMTNEQFNRVNKYCQRRLQRCPVQYIIGEWDFHDLNLKIKQPVFIPRPETEEMAQLIGEEMDSRLKKSYKQNFLEIGCGTGALSLYLLHKFSQIHGVAVDKSPAACELTKENAENLGLVDRLKIINMDIATENSLTTLQDLSPFDIILSNPPYIPTDEMEALEAEISRYEDHDALHGGQDGLDTVRRILTMSSYLLKKDGQVWLEVDVKHPRLIKNLVTDNGTLGLTYGNTFLDFMSRERFCMLKRSVIS